MKSKNVVDTEEIEEKMANININNNETKYPGAFFVYTSNVFFNFFYYLLFFYFNYNSE